MWIDFRNKNMFWNSIMKLKWTNSNVTTSPIFDGLFHVIKSLIIFIASFVRGYIMMLKLHEWSHEIWSENVIFKCKNYVPHLLFHVQIVVFRNSFFRHLCSLQKRFSLCSYHNINENIVVFCWLTGLQWNSTRF